MPRLSELRTLAGADAYVTNPAEAIRKLQSQGSTRPASGACCAARRRPCFMRATPSANRRMLRQSSSDGGYSLPKLLGILFLPQLLFFLYLLLRKQDCRRTRAPWARHRRGLHLTGLRPMCSTTGNVTRPKVARQLMAKVPALSELLEYYPQLELTVERPNS